MLRSSNAKAPTGVVPISATMRQPVRRDHLLFMLDCLGLGGGLTGMLIISLVAWQSLTKCLNVKKFCQIDRPVIAHGDGQHWGLLQQYKNNINVGVERVQFLERGGGCTVLDV